MRILFSITLYSFLEWGSLWASSFIFLWKDTHWRINIIVVGFRNSFYQMVCFLLQHDNTFYSWTRKGIYFLIHVILQFRNKSWSASFTPSLIRIHFVKLQRWSWFLWKVLIDLEAHFKVVISGNLIRLSWFAAAISLGFWNNFKHLLWYLKRIDSREKFFFYFWFLRKLFFRNMGIPNISHELKLANFAKY